MKPNWDEAPSEATHLAVDRNGYWCWFQNKPVFTMGSWWEMWSGHLPTVNKYDSAVDGAIDKALEARP